MFAYCNNNCPNFYDPNGNRRDQLMHAQHEGDFAEIDYIIYYLHPESSSNLEDPAKKNHSQAYCIFVPVGTFEEFASAMNSVPGYVDDVYIYLHSDETNFSFYHAQYYSADDISTSFEKIDIWGDIYLFSCKGGRGALASTIAATTQCPVVACRYKVSFGNGYARCGWWNYFTEYKKYGVYSWYMYYPNGNMLPYKYFVVTTR